MKLEGKYVNDMGVSGRREGIDLAFGYLSDLIECTDIVLLSF